ncbi:MAG TPA: lipid A deacylase LpxR family protein [Phycisphaerae bacterium]|nr:lipid A deacylase LpxR family protein [Phycisphaerae bacterium]
MTRTTFLAALLSTSSAFALDIPQLTLDNLPPTYIPGGTPRNTDYAFRLTLYWENDGGWAKPISQTDKHYTSGVGASASFQAPFIDQLLSGIPSINNEFDPAKSDYAMGLVGNLQIFTPADLSQSAPIPNDRPYAGWLYAGIFAQRANRFATVPVWESLEFDLGLVGPSSLAENAQSMIHTYYHFTKPEGWNNQINDEPDFDFKYNRRWRFELAKSHHYTPGFQILPDVGLTAGSIYDEVHAGATFRLGWNIPDDFGPGHLTLPEDFTNVVPCGCGNWFDDFFSAQSFYLFARPFGELVARDTTLQGDTWSSRDPVTVTPEPALFGVEYGLSHRFLKHFEFTYMWTSISPEFHRQHNWDTFASVQLSFFIAW